MNTSSLFHELNTACAFSIKSVYIPKKRIVIIDKMDRRLTKHESILEISIIYRILDDFDALQMCIVQHILVIASYCVPRVNMTRTASVFRTLGLYRRSDLFSFTRVLFQYKCPYSPRESTRCLGIIICLNGRSTLGREALCSFYLG